MADERERAALMEMARQLEQLAEEGGVAFDALLRRFNEQTRAACTRATFRTLYCAERPEDLVERLLEIRDAPPFVPPTTRAELLEVVGRAHGGGGGYVAGVRAGEALARMSRLPRDLADQLGSGFGTLACWPAHEEIVDFALAYEPPATRDALFAFVRRWLADKDAGLRSGYVAVGEEVLRERQAALRVPELERIVERLGSTIPERRNVGLRRLRELVGLEAAPAVTVASAPASPSIAAGEPAPPVRDERVRHAKFGVGVVLRREGAGPESKVSVRFESGDKTLLARFVTPFVSDEDA